MKERTQKEIDSFFENAADMAHLKDDMAAAISLMIRCAKSQGTIYVCGNGGSAADSEHISGELLKSFTLKRRITGGLESRLLKLYPEEGDGFVRNLQGGIRCIPLASFLSFSTAFQNDCDGVYAFAQLTEVFGRKGDVIICISTSGNSRNVVLAAKVARALDMSVISLTGESGGKLRGLSDAVLAAPSAITHRIQEFHIRMYHLMCLALESEMFDE